jgi:ribosomal protein L16 Arg81 hydroxylase
VTEIPGLAGLVAPLEAGQFFADVLGKAPRRFPGEKGRFAGLLPWPELDRVLRQHRLEFPRLRLALDGDVVPAHTYTEMVSTRRNGLVPRVLSAPFAEHLRAGATLVVDSVNELVDGVGELASRLEHDLRERIQVNLYAGWGTTHGFDVHWDDHDAFIIQLSGRKRWRLHGVTRRSPLQRDVELPDRPEGEPYEDFLLEDGDVLYLPRGHWHDVSAVGEESLHLTIGFNAATGVDLVAWLADQLRADELFREDLPRFAGPGARAERAEALRRRLAELTAGDDLVDRFLADRDAQAPAQTRVGLPWAATAELLPPDDDFEVRLLAPRAALVDGEGTVALVGAGKRLVFAAPARPVLAALLGGTPQPFKVLADAAPGVDRATVRALLGELVTQGLVARA